MYIKSCLSVKVMSAGTNDLELLTVSVMHMNSHCHFKYYVALFYRPPSSHIDIFDSLCIVLHSQQPHIFNNFILIGDFNVNYFHTQSVLYRHLTNSLVSFSLHQIVNSVTHTGPNGNSSLINLICLSNISSLHFCNTVPPLGNSDHNGIHLNLCKQEKNMDQLTKQRSIWNYTLADYNQAKDLIDETDWDGLLSDDINVSLTLWQERFLSIMDQCIPKVTLSKKKKLPWISKELLQFIKKKLSLFQKAKRSGHKMDFQKYKRCRNKVSTMLKYSKRKYINSLKYCYKKHFWKIVKSLNKKKTTIPTLSENGIHCKKWVVILTIRYGYLSCNIPIFCNYELSRGIGYPQGMMAVYLKRYRISTRNDACISQDTPCNITLSHRGSHVYNPTVLYFYIKV